MSQKIKHSKIKNTGLLFEILTRQVTANILNNKESKSVNLLKKYFNENTALGKEKELYNILLTNLNYMGFEENIFYNRILYILFFYLKN